MALAAQKNYYSVYLMTAYSSTPVGKRLAAEFEAAGKKLDVGKSCVRFKSLDDISLDAVGNAIAAMPVADFVAIYQDSRRHTSAGKRKEAKVVAMKRGTPAKKAAGKDRRTTS